MSYAAAFSLYWDLIGGRLLRPWEERLAHEIRLQRPLTPAEELLDGARTQHVYEKATGRRPAGSTLDEIRAHKEKYEESMRWMVKKLKSTNHWRRSRAIRRREAWFAILKEPFLNTCLPALPKVSCLTAHAGSVGLPPSLLEQLPCARSWAWFYLTKLYEHLILNLKVDKGDAYDMSYYIDAVPGGYLVTEDRRLIETCRRIPDRKMGVLRLKSLPALLGEWRIARKLRARP